MNDWIARLQLEPHPEGGYYRRIYTDPRTQSTAAGPRPLASSIHYLLTQQTPIGRLHRNRSTILHYLQDGGPVEYLLLPAAGEWRRVVLGTGPGQALFLEVPGGCWKGSRLLAAASHALVSEVVLPGFDFADHEFMSLAQLRSDWPSQADVLAELVRR
jgi:predicted cupin superfamily sugar epimerase